jgi:hypothetical protein
MTLGKVHIRWTWGTIVAAVTLGMATLAALADFSNNWQTVSAIVPFPMKAAVAQDIKEAIAPLSERQTRLEDNQQLLEARATRKDLTDLDFQITVLSAQQVDLELKVAVARDRDTETLLSRIKDQIDKLKTARNRAECEDANRYRITAWPC